MDIKLQLLEYFQISLETLEMILIINALTSGEKISFKKGIYLLTIYNIGYLLGQFLLNKNSPYFIVIFTIFLVSITSKGKLLTKSILTIFLMVVHSVLFGLFVTFVLNGNEEIIYVLSADLIILLITLFTLYIIKKFDVKVALNHLALSFLTLGIGNILVLILVYNAYGERLGYGALIVIFALMLGMLVTSIFLTSLNLKRIKENIEDKSNLKQQKRALELQEKYLSELTNYYEDLRKFRHDMKGYVDTIDYLSKMEDYTKLKSYVSKIEGQLDLNISECPNIYIAAVVESTIRRCREEKISFDFEFNLTKKIMIESVDISSLFYNLLSNSYEAAKLSETKYIELKVQGNKKDLLIELSNSVEESLSLDKLRVGETSKDDTVNHGFGLGKIKSIVEKYQGSQNAILTEDGLKITIMLQHVLSEDNFDISNE